MKAYHMKRYALVPASENVSLKERIIFIYLI